MLRPSSKPCPNCGNPMHRQSKMCQNCHFAKISATLERNCQVCGNTSTLHESDVRLGRRLCCSKACAVVARVGKPTSKRNRTQYTCLLCGATVERRLCEQRRKATDKYFCTTECWYAYNQKDNHYLWTGGQHERINAKYTEWRKCILERDNYSCRRCGSVEKLEVHHILPFGRFPNARWDIANGVALCRLHHNQTRGRELDFVEELRHLVTQTA